MLSDSLDPGAAGREEPGLLSPGLGEEPGLLSPVLTPQVVLLAQVPSPAGAAAGEHHGSDEIPPAEPHRVPFPSPFPCQEQENQAAQSQQRAPHAASVVLSQLGVGRAGGIQWGILLGHSHLY